MPLRAGSRWGYSPTQWRPDAKKGTGPVGWWTHVRGRGRLILVLSICGVLVVAGAVAIKLLVVYRSVSYVFGQSSHPAVHKTRFSDQKVRVGCAAGRETTTSIR